MTPVRIFVAVLCFAMSRGTAAAQPGAPAAAAPQTAKVSAPAAATVPVGFVIGADDILSVLVWGNKDMSVDAITVRPDGKISLPLLNDVQAAGFTPEDLRKRLEEAVTKYVKEPDVSVVVKEIHSRKVAITGMVAKPNTYPLASGMTIVQLIAQAGGLLEYANAEDIRILRAEGGRQVVKRFNYKDVVKRPDTNIELVPGDTVIVQ